MRYCLNTKRAIYSGPADNTLQYMKISMNCNALQNERIIIHYLGCTIMSLHSLTLYGKRLCIIIYIISENQLHEKKAEYLTILMKLELLKQTNFFFQKHV